MKSSHSSNLTRYSVVTAAALLLFPQLLWATVPFSITGPNVDPNDFRMTTFASGLNFPIGMVELDDGSILTAVSNGTNGFFSSTSGSIIRLVDADQDGVAESQSTLVADVPGGGLSALRKSGELVFATGQGRGKPISIFRVGATPADPLTMVGRIDLTYPDPATGNWLHPHSALSVRETPGVPGSHDLIFQLGSDSNVAVTTRTVSLTSDIGVSGTLSGDALHMVRITDTGATVTGSNLTQLATGLRNPAGHAFHPVTGDLYLEDNGIDGIAPVPAIEPTSADELNVIPVGDIGGTIEDFGFPFNYEEYRTEVTVGDPAFSPLVAFQPIPTPDGSEAEGPNDIAFAPSTFPSGLNNGIFVGMHGQFSGGGVANEENPLVFVDLADNSYFHFIENTEPGVGHLDGLLPTANSLFIADVSPEGGFGRRQSNTGAIYQIKSVVPEPGCLIQLCMAGLLLLISRRRSG